MLLATYLYILHYIVFDTTFVFGTNMYYRSDTLCASVISQGQSKKGCRWRQKSQGILMCHSSKEVVCYVKSLIFRLFEIVHHKEVLKFTDQGQNNVQI